MWAGKGGRDGGRKGWREGGMEGGRKGGREEGREGGRKGEREEGQISLNSWWWRRRGRERKVCSGVWRDNYFKRGRERGKGKMLSLLEEAAGKSNLDKTVVM